MEPHMIEYELFSPVFAIVVNHVGFILKTSSVFGLLNYRSLPSIPE
jgi:hypothetical protein